MKHWREQKILVVEDEPELRADIAEELQSLGSEVLVACDGEEGLEVLRHHRVGAILSDINMPKKSGLELLYDVRNQGLETPFVILSAYHDKMNVLKALKLGATDFLEKPFKLDLLKETMTKAMQLGFEMRKIEDEIAEMCQKLNLPAEKAAYLKRAHLMIRIMRKDMEIYTKKVA